MLARRRRLYDRYVAKIAAVKGLTLSWQAAPRETIRSVCCFLLPTRELRDHFERQLGRARISTRRWYLPTVNRHPAFRHLQHFPTPVADNVSRRLLGIPFYLSLEDTTSRRIMSALGEAASSAE